MSIKKEVRDFSKFQYDEEFEHTNLITLKWFFNVICYILSGVIIASIVYYSQNHPVNDSNMRRQALFSYKREVVHNHNMIKDNPFITMALLLLAVFTIVLVINIYRIVTCLLMDKVKIAGRSNRLSQYTGNRLRFSKEGKLQVYRDDIGHFTKDVILNDFLFVLLCVIAIIVLILGQFIVEVVV